MSDSYIILIPENPQSMPAPERQEQALRAFQKMAGGAEKVEAAVSEQVRFVDCGENFERVLCPACERELDQRWWQKQMDEDFDSGFQLQKMELSCCGAQRTLHELRYDWPQGFARLSIAAMNPDLAELSPEQVTLMETILGCPVRVIYQHI